jgi:hypothetical protein
VYIVGIYIVEWLFVLPEEGKLTPKHVKGAALIFVLIMTVHYVGVKNGGLCNEVHVLANDQLDAQIFNTFITILYMYMFRAISCLSSGGQIVLIQHLVSSL